MQPDDEEHGNDDGTEDASWMHGNNEHEQYDDENAQHVSTHEGYDGEYGVALMDEVEGCSEEEVGREKESGQTTLF